MDIGNNVRRRAKTRAAAASTNIKRRRNGARKNRLNALAIFIGSPSVRNKITHQQGRSYRRHGDELSLCGGVLHAFDQPMLEQIVQESEDLGFGSERIDFEILNLLFDDGPN